MRNLPTSYSIGQAAEIAAAKYLTDKSFKIMSHNWRTKWCEIDLIAMKNSVIYFVEVKYRENDNQGSGLEYITQNKLNQMARAAESWIQQNNWDGDYQLSAIEVSGLDFQITEYIDELYLA